MRDQISHFFSPVPVSGLGSNKTWWPTIDPFDSLLTDYDYIFAERQKYVNEIRNWASDCGMIPVTHHDLHFSFLPLDEAIASRAVLVIVSGSDGRADENAFGAS